MTRLPARTIFARGKFLTGGFILAGLTIAVLLFAGCGGSDSGNSASRGPAKFYCPMHPTYTSDRPGDCPICNMKLVPIQSSGVGSSNAVVAGRSTIVVSPEKRQTIGLATSPVERRRLARILRVPATVVHDETRLARIAPRYGGWVQSLQVNFTGQPVEQGQPLFTVYSPELFTAENDYLVVLRNQRAATNNAVYAEASAGMLETARRRLALLQVSDEEIRALEERGHASDQLQIRAPISGHVITRNAVAGQAFEAGETLYEIADLSRLWVIAMAPEYELPLVSVGQRVTAHFSVLSEPIQGTVAFIGPHLDPASRRAEVRIEVDNPGHQLKPEMWGHVELAVDFGEVLAVPASAIIDTGTRVIGFAAGEKDHLEPRELKIGRRTDDYVEVLGGVSEGERIVTRALFLVDSESQLRAAVEGMR